VAQRPEPEFFADSTLHVVEFGGKELNRVAARCADHVVMCAAVQAMFVADDPVLKIDFERKSALGKQLKSAVDRGVPDARILLLDELVQFFRTQVVARFEEHVEHLIAFATLLQALLAEIPGENVFRNTEQIVAGHWCIVDALLGSFSQGFFLIRLYVP